MIDDVQIKTASRTQKVTFNKKDYQGFDANNWVSGTPKATVAKV